MEHQYKQDSNLTSKGQVCPKTHTNRLRDKNGNCLLKVAVESELAESLLSRPHPVLLKAIQAVSDNLFYVFNTQVLTEEGDNLLTRLLSFPPFETLLMEELSVKSFQVGKLAAKSTQQRMDQALLAQLSEPVSDENCLRHFKIAQVLSYLLYDFFYAHSAYTQLPIAQSFDSLLSLLTGYTDAVYNRGIYRETLSQIHPAPSEMEALRVLRQHDGPAETAVKGIYARDYRHEERNMKGCLPPHIRGADIWQIQQDVTCSAFLEEASEHDMPLIAGASGSAARLLVLIDLMSVSRDSALTHAFKQQYKAYLLAYIVGCGHHSMHEVGHVLKKNGEPYSVGDYYSLIPETVLAHDTMKHIIQETIKQTYHQGMKSPKSTR